MTRDATPPPPTWALWGEAIFPDHTVAISFAMESASGRTKPNLFLRDILSYPLWGGRGGGVLGELGGPPGWVPGTPTYIILNTGMWGF